MNSSSSLGYGNDLMALESPLPANMMTIQPNSGAFFGGGGSFSPGAATFMPPQPAIPSHPAVSNNTTSGASVMDGAPLQFQVTQLKSTVTQGGQRNQSLDSMIGGLNLGGGGGMSNSASPPMVRTGSLPSKPSPPPAKPYVEQFNGLDALPPTGAKPNMVPAFPSKGELLRNFAKSEEKYVRALHEFKEGFIDLIEKRDNDDRRRLFDHPKLAVTMGLFQSIYDWNLTLAKGLRAYSNANGSQQEVKPLVDLMVRFAPGLRLYASYASNNSEGLNALVELDRVVARFLKQNPLKSDLPIEKVLYLPCERYPVYQQYLAELLTFIPPNDPDFESLTEAYRLIAEGTQFVEDTLRDQAVHMELLALQSLFIGHVDIFAPNRRLLREGHMARVKVDKKDQREESPVYAHLFNDALLISTRVIGGYLKVRPIGGDLTWLLQSA